jgi:hypothetical protein
LRRNDEFREEVTVPDGEIVFRFFEALPGIFGCALGFWLLWASIFFREVRFGMSRKNMPLHGPLAFLVRVFTAMIALYAILMGGKIALEHLSLWPGLTRRLSVIARFPIDSVVEIALVALFSAMTFYGAILLTKRASDWKTRMVGSALVFGCGLVVFAILHFGLRVR